MESSPSRFVTVIILCVALMMLFRAARSHAPKDIFPNINIPSYRDLAIYRFDARGNGTARYHLQRIFHQLHVRISVI